MNVQARYTALTCATLAGLLMLSACGKNEQESNTTPAAPAASAPAAPKPEAPATPAPASTAPAPGATSPAHPASSPTKGGMSAVKSSNDIHVASVTLGTAVDSSLAVSKEQRHFSPADKAIYASVATEGSTNNATLNATWSYVDGKNQTFSTTSELIATDGPATTTFKVQNPNAWPQGKYKVEISLNGKTVASEDFDIRG